ncbi:MAG: DUF3800 domain-containing protein [Patescibacteria group bacterium]
MSNFDIINLMVVFIDESGIHKQEGHSTVAVVYVEIFNLLKFQEQFEEILKRLRIKEFHWADHGWKVRKKFFEAIASLDYLFKVAIFENPTNQVKMMEIVFQHLITEKNIRSIFIDCKKPKWYEQDLKRVLRAKGITVKKLKTVRKETSYFGVQLADALAGLIRYSKDNPGPDVKEMILSLKRGKKLFGEYLFTSIK